MSERNVPEVRFRGFSGEWVRYELGDIGNTYTGLSGKTKNDFGHGSGKYVTYMNVFSNAIANLYDVEIIEVDATQNVIKMGDVFFTTSSETPEEVGMSSVWLEDTNNVYLNSFCFGYRPEKIFDYYYLAYMLRSPSVRKKITFLAQGISRYNISKNKAMNISVPIPKTQEQAKIGEFFKNLNNLIVQNQKKYDKLVNMKKACLDKMFPKDGADTPEVRFKGFGENWENITFDKVAEYKKGPFGSALTKSLFIPKSANSVKVYEQQNAINKNWKLERYYISADYAKKLNAFEVKSGDIIVSCAGTIGEIYEIPLNADAGIINQALMRIHVNEEIVEKKLFICLFSNMIDDFTRIHSNGSAMKNIPPFAALKPTMILIPTKEEQRKVIDFLDNLDNLITLQKTKLQKLKNIKKACLDKMFI